VARGNVVLVDAGRTVEEPLGTVPVLSTQPPCEDGCPDPPIRVAGRFQPRLQRQPLTFRAPVEAAGPASAPISPDPRLAVPQLVAHDGSREWDPVPDLLSSCPDDSHVVVESDDEGVSRLRFGDDVLGRAPGPGAPYAARYRVGNGPGGNVGADTIAHVVQPGLLDGSGLQVTNPLPARGGRAPESVADVRLLAPRAFRRDRQRAVTAADYAELAQRDFPAAVQRAAADLRWNGSWYEARVAVDAFGTPEPPTELLGRVDTRLERYRRVAHDLRAVPARSVGLDISLLVCVASHHRRADVARDLRERLGNRRRADGSLGLFHPDAVTFGTPVAVSSLVAVAAGVEGIDSVTVTGLRRSDGIDDGALESGVLQLRGDEVPRVDNDPGAPVHGVLTLDLRGGR
jgi:predicted phage baseplate assembly protein